MTPPNDRRGAYATARYFAEVVVLAALYVALARLGLQLDPVSRFATFVWPPSGLALAALILLGANRWPGIALGAAVVNVSIGAPVPVALGIAVGNTLEALLGSYAVQRIPEFRLTLDRLSDVLAFTGLAALASTCVSATIGVTSLYLGRLVPQGAALATWVAWWEGDAIGVLLVAPFILNWASLTWIRVALPRALEAALLGAALTGASLFLFGGDPSNASPLRQPTMLLPVLIWASVRFGTRGATAATLLVSTVAVWSTARGHGPFVHGELHQSLAALQAFMSVVAVTFLVLSAVTAERERVDRERSELYQRERLLARVHADEMERQRQA